MKRYLDRSGGSGVTAYALGPDWIDVRFRKGGIYRYSHASAGIEHVAVMRNLAEAGQGLSTYISQHVHDRHASRR